MASAQHRHASMLHQHHHYSKKTITRAARSAPISKFSFNTNNTKHLKSDEELAVDEFDDDDTVSSFLQFCAMCEKQIVIPNSTILYCSESCRRKDAQVHDSNPSLSFLNPHPALPTYQSESSFTTGTVLPRKLPTPRPPELWIPPITHNGRSDIDPTEWKPADHKELLGIAAGQKAATWKPKLWHRPSSEAYCYLSKFHRSAPAVAPRPVSPLYSTPSLVDTPTTTLSSSESIDVTPYELLPRPTGHKQEFATAPSGNFGEAKVISPPLITFGNVELAFSTRSGVESTRDGGPGYTKRNVHDKEGAAAGSLKRLLGNEILDNITAFAI